LVEGRTSKSHAIGAAWAIRVRYDLRRRVDVRAADRNNCMLALHSQAFRGSFAEIKVRPAGRARKHPTWTHALYGR
jgi:hypothetical protein